MLRIERLGRGDDGKVLAARRLFDDEPQPEWTRLFLESPGHHLLLAYEGEVPVGFVTGIELAHPGQALEMFLYELGVEERFRRRGIGAALVAELRDLARQLGCHGMWVLTDSDNSAALRTYRKTGGGAESEQLLLEWRLRVDGGDSSASPALAALHLVPPGFVVSAMRGGDPLSVGLENEIRSSYRTLSAQGRKGNVGVAVRSSGIDEDGSNNSFAGQHATYLNVRGEDAVLNAVARCSESVLSPVALAYREAHGLSGKHPRIAVLVQTLVESASSAVVFSANPITGAADEVMITSAWGLGESVVGGTVTPDLFVLQRPALKVLSHQIYSKDVMTVLASGGTKEVDVAAHLRGLPSLDGSQVIEIARLAIKLERAMGWPVDVECALAYGELYLLQCRPITALNS